MRLSPAVISGHFVEAPHRGRLWRRSTFASLALHAVFATLLLFLVSAPRLKPARQQIVNMEIVMVPRAPAPPPGPPPRGKAGNLSNNLPATRPGDLAALPGTAPAPARPRDDTPVVVKPSHMLSAAILADPRSWKARRMLAGLNRTDRDGQLCGLEAMAQVAAWNTAFKPDLVIAYAMADLKLSGDTLLADGAALHSREEWFRLKFKCGLTPDHSKVAAFEFVVGKTIPRRDWQSHNLPSRVEPLD